jgi:hypothetical protein
MCAAICYCCLQPGVHAGPCRYYSHAHAARNTPCQESLQSRQQSPCQRLQSPSRLASCICVDMGQQVPPRPTSVMCCVVCACACMHLISSGLVNHVHAFILCAYVQGSRGSLLLDVCYMHRACTSCIVRASCVYIVRVHRACTSCVYMLMLMHTSAGLQASRRV